MKVIRSLMIIFFIISAIGTPILNSQPQKIIHIQDALKKKLVTAHCTVKDKPGLKEKKLFVMMRIVMTRKSNEPLWVVVPLGTYFRPDSNNYSALVSTRMGFLDDWGPFDLTKKNTYTQEITVISIQPEKPLAETPKVYTVDVKRTGISDRDAFNLFENGKTDELIQRLGNICTASFIVACYNQYRGPSFFTLMVKESPKLSRQFTSEKYKLRKHIPMYAEELRKVKDEALSILLYRLKKKNLTYVSNSYSAHLLGILGDKRAVPALIDYLKKKDRRGYAREAIIALGKLGDKRAISYLISFLNHKHNYVRHPAAEALRALGWKPKDEQESIHSAIARLDIDTLVSTGANCVPEILEVLNKDRLDLTVAKKLLQALGRIGKVDAIVTCLKNKHSHVRENALDALIKLKCYPTIPNILKLAYDWDVHPHDGKALGLLGWEPSSSAEKVHYWISSHDVTNIKKNPESVKIVLLSDIQSGDPQKVNNALYSIISIGDNGLIDHLKVVLNKVGNKKMAEVFFNSGNKELQSAAREWARLHGFTIFQGRGANKARWGEW